MAGVGARIHSVTTSETKISCVIDRVDQARAAAAMKEAFRL
jgi:aspartokinase